MYRLDRPECFGLSKEQRTTLASPHRAANRQSSSLDKIREYERKATQMRTALRHQEQTMSQLLQVRAQVKAQLNQFGTIN